MMHDSCLSGFFPARFPAARRLGSESSDEEGVGQGCLQGARFCSAVSYHCVFSWVAQRIPTVLFQTTGTKQLSIFGTDEMTIHAPLHPSVYPSLSITATTTTTTTTSTTTTSTTTTNNNSSNVFIHTRPTRLRAAMLRVQNAI